MPNFATALKGEMSRLSTKAARQHVAPVQSATSALRKQVSVIKKQLRELERQVAALNKQVARTKPTPTPENETKIRLTPKGLRSLRHRLGLNAAEFGSLVNVGQQTIYNWENEKTQPRPAQMPAIAELRKIGKREARARLENGAAGG